MKKTGLPPSSSTDFGYLFRPRADPGEPSRLHELQVARGVMGAVEPWLPGMVLVAIGSRRWVLPDDLELGEPGQKIEVAKVDGKYSVWRPPA